MRVDNKNVHVTAIKQAEDGNGIIVRYYNPTEENQSVKIEVEGMLYRCKMDESIVEKIEHIHIAEPKKIVTVRIVK